MDILNTLSHSINIELFSTFAGLSLVALGIVSAIQLFNSNKETLPETANSYFGVSFFIASFIIFILGLLTSLVLNSLNTIWYHNLAFKIIEVSLKGFLLLSGIIVLIGGIDALVLRVLKRGLRSFPRNCGLLMCILEMFLPTKPEFASKQKGLNVKYSKGKKESTNSDNVQSSGRLQGDERKLVTQISNQLKTLFIFMLLTLWLAIERQGKDISIKRMEWWYFVVISLVFLFLYIIRKRKRIANLCYRWLSPMFILVYIWIIYWISGIHVPADCFFVLSFILFLWISILILALALITARKGRGGKLGEAIKWVARVGEILWWPLSIATFFGSVVLGWSRLSNTGVRDWWMEPLLIIGLLVSLGVALIYTLGIDRENDH